MKKVLCIVLTVVLVAVLFGCAHKDKTANTKIDLGESEVYTQEDRETAAKLILDEVSDWEGIKTLHNIRYAGDEWSAEESGDRKHDTIVFLSDFKTVKSSSKAGGFNTDMEYTDWNWIIEKNNDGQWELRDWGY